MKSILHTPPKPSDPIKQKTGEGCSGATCSALMELQEAMNDLSTIRSGPSACSGYIDDMARAKDRIKRAAAILANCLYKAEKRRAHGASTREMMREIFDSPNDQGDGRRDKTPPRQ